MANAKTSVVTFLSVLNHQLYLHCFSLFARLPFFIVYGTKGRTKTEETKTGWARYLADKKKDNLPTYGFDFGQYGELLRDEMKGMRRKSPDPPKRIYGGLTRGRADLVPVDSILAILKMEFSCGTLHICCIRNVFQAQNPTP